MIVTDEEKVIFYREISADSPINNVVIRSNIPQKRRPDSLLLGSSYSTSSHQPAAGYVTIYKHTNPPQGYGHSFVGKRTYDDGRNYITHIFGGTVDQTAIGVQPITNISFVGDTNASGTVTWYGWIKVSKV